MVRRVESPLQVLLSVGVTLACSRLFFPTPAHQRGVGHESSQTHLELEFPALRLPSETGDHVPQLAQGRVDLLSSPALDHRVIRFPHSLARYGSTVGPLGVGSGAALLRPSAGTSMWYRRDVLVVIVIITRIRGGRG